MFLDHRPRVVATLTWVAFASWPAVSVAQSWQGNLTVQSSSSSLTLGGIASGIPVTRQGTGSLTTSYSGAIGITPADLATLQLTFNPSAGPLVANVSGNWQPQVNGVSGSAPANYGGLIDDGFLGGVRFAVRDLTAAITTSTPVTLTALGGGEYSFPTNQTLTLTGTSAVDYEGYGIFGAGVGSGRELIAGETATNAGGNGTLRNLGGGDFSITYPVSLSVPFDIGGEPATFTLVGTITAQGTLTPVPEPAGPLALAATAAAVGWWRRRRTCGRIQVGRSARHPGDETPPLLG